MAWLEQVKAPSQQVVFAIKRTRKGLILKTPEYDVFLWEDSVLAKQLLEALAFWEANNNLGVELVVLPDKSLKQGFKVLPGKSALYFLSENSWTTIEPEEEELGNPFLQATPFANSPAHPIPAEGSARTRAKKAAKDLAEKTPPNSFKMPSEAS